MTCTHGDCNGRHKARGLCKMHYHRFQRGTLDAPRYSVPRPPVGQAARPRFDFKKVDGVWFRSVKDVNQWKKVVYA